MKLQIGKRMTKIGQKRTTKRKPIKKRNNHALKVRLDITFSKHIRDKANNTCEFCGKSNLRVECHHGVVHRRYMNTRYEEDNCVCVCSACHRFLSDFPGVNYDFFKKRIGSARMEQLEALARSGNKISLDEISAKLKEK